MKAPKVDIRINLKKKPQDFFGPLFLKWAVNIGRIVIVGTELILIAALIFRFIVDKDIIDLNDQIKTKVTFIDQQAKIEKDFRDLHDRLNVIKKVVVDTDRKMKLLKIMEQSAREKNFTIERTVMSADTIAFDALTLTIQPLHDFVTELKQVDDVAEISIDQIKSASGKIKFIVSVTIKTDET